MKKNFNLSLPEWMIQEIIGQTDNRSGRIQELLMKGHLYEKEQVSNQKFKKENNTPTGIMREKFNPVRYDNNFFDRVSEFAI